MRKRGPDKTTTWLKRAGGTEKSGIYIQERPRQPKKRGKKKKTSSGANVNSKSSPETVGNSPKRGGGRDQLKGLIGRVCKEKWLLQKKLIPGSRHRKKKKKPFILWCCQGAEGGVSARH